MAQMLADCPSLIAAYSTLFGWWRKRRNKSLVVKRSIVISGHRTRVSVEPAFWKAFKEIAAARNVGLSHLATEIYSTKEYKNFSSAIRVFVVDEYRKRATEHAINPIEIAIAGPRAAQRSNEMARVGTASAAEFQGIIEKCLYWAANARSEKNRRTYMQMAKICHKAAISRGLLVEGFDHKAKAMRETRGARRRKGLGRVLGPKQ
jgi:predicted DNA-binding ribbon-helix-helix protein